MNKIYGFISVISIVVFSQITAHAATSSSEEPKIKLPASGITINNEIEAPFIVLAQRVLAQRRPAGRPGFKGPAVNKRPAIRPSINRPRPSGWRPPNTRPNRPYRPNRPNRPTVIPPTMNPDGTFKPRPRPGNWRPPNNRPPGYRPPNYRPPGYYRPYDPYYNRPYREPNVIVITPPPRSSATSGDRRPIRNGMRGQRVRLLQLALRDAGLDVDVDGFFGNDTDRAVRNYQKLVGLPVTGVADARTLSSLGL